MTPSILQKKFSSLFSAEKRATASRGDWIFSGILILATLFLLLLAWDGYVFYLVRLEAREEAISRGAPVNLSEKDINETVKLLDARGQKFSEILEDVK